MMDHSEPLLPMQFPSECSDGECNRPVVLLASLVSGNFPKLYTDQVALCEGHARRNVVRWVENLLGQDDIKSVVLVLP